MKATKHLSSFPFSFPGGAGALALLVLMLAASPQVYASPIGTAFTYQGSLSSGTNAATGLFDLRFTLYDAAADGNTLGGPVTNSAVAITNGYFLATLDFGNLFDGSARWLEIAVRASGEDAFTGLSPRQALLPVPYALTSASASNLLGSLATTQLNGTISLDTLPKEVLTNNAGGVNLNGNFSGNGAGLNNLNAPAKTNAVFYISGMGPGHNLTTYGMFTNFSSGAAGTDAPDFAWLWFPQLFCYTNPLSGEVRPMRHGIFFDGGPGSGEHTCVYNFPYHTGTQPELIAESTCSIALCFGVGKYNLPGANTALQIGVNGGLREWVFFYPENRPEDPWILNKKLWEAGNPWDYHTMNGMPLLFPVHYVDTNEASAFYPYGAKTKQGSGMVAPTIMSQSYDKYGVCGFSFFDYFDSSRDWTNQWYWSNASLRARLFGDGPTNAGGMYLRGRLLTDQQRSVVSSSTCLLDAGRGAVMFLSNAAQDSITFVLTNAVGTPTNVERQTFVIHAGSGVGSITWPTNWCWLGGSNISSLAEGVIARIELEILGPNILVTQNAVGKDPLYKPVTYDPDALAFLARVASVGGTTNKIIITAINSLVINAKENGWWTNCDVIYPFVGGTAASHALNLTADNRNIAWVGTDLTHDANGVTGNGSGYGDLGFAPSGASRFALDSAHIFGYMGTDLPSGYQMIAGSDSGGSTKAVFMSKDWGLSKAIGYNGINNGTYSGDPGHINLGTDITGGTLQGPCMITRTDASNHQLYCRQYAGSGTGPSVSLSTKNFYIFAWNANGSAVLQASFNLRGFSIGSGISPAMWAAMRTDWDNFEQALGRKAP
jgi:hypothetical protein